LIELGHDVLTVADENLLSHPDTKIAQTAKEEQRMLMTLDIEFVRRTDLDKLTACIAVVDPVHVRVRYLLINKD
jgi:predicted nuclease of predicted toxin-antitoxin system